MDGATTIAVVLNPRTLAGPRAVMWQQVLTQLRSHARVALLETTGDAGDRQRIAALLAAERPSIAVAAGGDGTVREVASAVHAAPDSPALGILPFGTGNNVARSLGLASLRLGAAGSLDAAIGAIVGGHERRVDVGRVGDEIFVGSFALGMDGAILAARNAWRRRWSLSPALAGYPLYLLSCAVNLATQRAVLGSVECDAAPYRGPIHDLLVVNMAIYAGEFRFDPGDRAGNGRLDLRVFTGPLDYVRAFATAWRRHVRHQRGEPVSAAPHGRSITRALVTLSSAQPSQTDGEEHARATRFEISVLPSALRIKVPPP